MKTIHSYSKEMYMSGEELYQFLHVSKRKMKYMLENGYLPYIDTGKKTHRYIVLRTDAETFAERLKNDQVVKADLKGLFNSTQIPLPPKIDEESCKQFAKHLHEIWRNEPDALPVGRVAELVGLHRGRICELCKQGRLFYVNVEDRWICSKENVIAHFSSPEVLRKLNMTQRLGELAKGFCFKPTDEQ